MKAIFSKSDGVQRMVGYTTTGYESNIPGQELVETSVDELASIFDDAKAASEPLDGTDESIDAAIDDPLSFLNFLILVDGSIEFDPDYVRETPDGAQA